MGVLLRITKDGVYGTQVRSRGMDSVVRELLQGKVVAALGPDVHVEEEGEGYCDSDYMEYHPRLYFAAKKDENAKRVKRHSQRKSTEVATWRLESFVAIRREKPEVFVTAAYTQAEGEHTGFSDLKVKKQVYGDIHQVGCPIMCNDTGLEVVQPQSETEEAPRHFKSLNCVTFALQFIKSHTPQSLQ